VRPTFRPDEGGDGSTALRLSYEALDHSHFDVARELAQSVLIAARAGSNRQLEAEALKCLAHCDRAAFRLERASDTSRTAAVIFEHLGDTDGEARALTTLAHVSMLLGRSDEAVEAALLCVRLCEKAPQPSAVFAHNCLGIAYGWGGRFAAAEKSLEQAVDAATACTPPLSTYEPRVNLAWVEATRLVNERFHAGTMGSKDKFFALVVDLKKAADSDDGISITPALTPLNGVVPIVLQGLAACWQGDLPQALALQEMALRALKGTVTWLDALIYWLGAELWWAERNWGAVEDALLQMSHHATGARHEHLACLAHLMRAQAFEIHERYIEAVQEHRRLRERERALAGHSLVSREASVGWRLDARESERHLEQALIASKKFERWSLEDALTGISNRRYFELTLGKRLNDMASSGQCLTVAMIDVDRFKAINDTFSHQVGDQVLATLAKLLVASIRDVDLAARLAGDEFVVLFDSAGRELALQICERIQTALACFDWNALADGLQPSISVGIEEAVRGDTVEGLLRRSDRSMYSVKPGWVHTDL
jgi:diguanylate cyclase (GGDEF)-like protein